LNQRWESDDKNNGRSAENNAQRLRDGQQVYVRFCVKERAQQHGPQKIGVALNPLARIKNETVTVDEILYVPERDETVINYIIQSQAVPDVRQKH
jgi:hypothetical protein